MSLLGQIQNGKVAGIIFHRDGDRLIVTDGRGRQYACSTAQELWDDMISILGADDLPKMIVGAPGEEGTNTGAGEEFDAKSFFEAFCHLGSEVVGDAYGPFLGKLAAHASRRGAPAAMSFFKKISRPSKPPKGSEVP